MSELSTRRPTEQRNAGTYYHPHFDAHIVKVMLGQHKISRRVDEMLVTTLGSCVAACIRDPVAVIGEIALRLRDDVVSEPDQREANQRSAPEE